MLSLCTPDYVLKGKQQFSQLNGVHNTTLFCMRVYEVLGLYDSYDKENQTFNFWELFLALQIANFSRKIHNQRHPPIAICSAACYFASKTFQNMPRDCNIFVVLKCSLPRTRIFIILNNFVFLPLLYLRCFWARDLPRISFVS